MARGGYRAGAGRPKGATKASKQEKAVERTLEAAPPESKRFKTALDFAMDVINRDDAPMDAKIRLAIAAMPFQHPKMEAAVAGKKEQKEEAAKAAAQGRFAPPAPPKLAVDNTR
ncbi:hypothetical protein [Azospirillum tabaci]|uniref:hypothetical protein n=1 Tax=Azospirillum tabaci TaxID=2752310 RepID=UPI00166062D8|nr:hypothetical protein [Azospirillum tabaci]